MGIRELTVDGITDTVLGWAERNKISVNTIYKRLQRGYSDDDAVEPTENIVYKRAILRKLWHGKWKYVGTKT